VKRWSELKEAFWGIVDLDPAEQARQLAALASADPELHREVEVLLAADARGESLQQIFEAPGMSLAPPALDAPARPNRIGQYDIIDVLGAGGMGEVYRAYDSRLHREVAIKVLPEAVARDPDRRARFEREARILASLNHPHIAQVYGLEDAGGTPALVMELVESQTLAQQIADAAAATLPLTAILTVARQIADGLDAAHEKGIIHRDLKPSNIALTSGGQVKILDFGIAKSLGHAGAGDAAGTHPGMILGTPAYMSPEQARGLAIDKRTDIWAFGCVLYELLSGRRPFGGATASDNLAAVLERDPDWTCLRPDTPPAIRSLLRHCLDKDPKRRLRDIADARLAIDEALNQPVSDTVRPATASIDPTPRRPSAWLLLALAGFGIAAAGGAAIWFARVSPSTTNRTVVASVVLPGGLHLGGVDPQARAAELKFAVSPDGRRLAIVATDDSGRVKLWLRDLDSSAFRPLPDTDEASFPFWSPDSEHIGFIAAGKLKRIRAAGGESMTVSATAFRTSAWSREGVILFTPAASSALYRVPASGGNATPVTTLDKAGGEIHHSYPSFLPDHRHFLYFSIGTRNGANDPRGIFLGSLDGAAPVLLLPGVTYARFANGRLLFLRNGTLMAQPFDTERLEAVGAPYAVVEQVKETNTGATGVTGAFSVSDSGVLAYQSASAIASQLVWFDRTGRQIAAAGTPPADYGDVALSADGTRLVVSVANPAFSNQDLWLYDVQSGRGERFTFDAADEFAPVWSPDGARVLFSAMRNGSVDLYVKEVSGLSNPRPLAVDTLGLGRFAADWSRDDRFIMYIGGGRAIARSDLWVASPTSDPQARALLDSPFLETQGRFAPAGGWFIYTSNETGKFEVYIDRFPQRGAKRLVSAGGGGWGRWTRGGREILYLAPNNQLMAVEVQGVGDRLDVGQPRPLFTLRARATARLDAYPYDISADGQRVVVNALVDDPTSASITVMFDWTARE